MKVKKSNLLCTICGKKYRGYQSTTFEIHYWLLKENPLNPLDTTHHELAGTLCKKCAIRVEKILGVYEPKPKKQHTDPNQTGLALS